MTQKLNQLEQKTLLIIARDAIIAAVDSLPPKNLDSYHLSPTLMDIGASFVTLTKSGHLRGCIGTIIASQALAKDVQLRAQQAATEDPRFPRVQPEELPHILIEVSRLTTPQPLNYSIPSDLPKLLNPYQDGVILEDGFRRATFLPQVWDQLPKPEDFLTHLCQKMGAVGGLWKTKLLDVSIYKVESFSE